MQQRSQPSTVRPLPQRALAPGTRSPWEPGAIWRPLYFPRLRREQTAWVL